MNNDELHTFEVCVKQMDGKLKRKIESYTNAELVSMGHPKGAESYKELLSTELMLKEVKRANQPKNYHEFAPRSQA